MSRVFHPLAIAISTNEDSAMFSFIGTPEHVIVHITYCILTALAQRLVVVYDHVI